MVQWSVKDMGGEMPRTDPRLLPPAMAEDAWNVDLQSGPLDGLGVPLLIKDLTAAPDPVMRAYRLPGPVVGDPDAWLPLPSPYSSCVRSPLANDQYRRVYWTSPGENAKWSTYDDIRNGWPPYDLGVIQPTAAYTPVVSASGGTAPDVVPWVSRSYLITFINSYGEESAPSPPSDPVDGASDGDWQIWVNGALPGPVAGRNYPGPITIRLYRTVVGQTSGAVYYQVRDFKISLGDVPPQPYHDTLLDSEIVGNLVLASTNWVNPPDNLDGMTVMPGGMLVGFTRNTVHFCEPDHPHAWPASYDQSLIFDIVGFGVWQQSLVALTLGTPAIGSGQMPSSFTFSGLQVPEPCISRGSIITDLMGVYYSSQNGLIMLNYMGMQNMTLQQVTRNIWLEEYKGASLIACRHRSQFLAINGGDHGFIIDYGEPRLGVIHIDPVSGADCVWNDPYDGSTFIINDKLVYRWDDPTAQAMTWRWRSKKFNLPKPTNIGAVQLWVSKEVTTAVAPPAPPMSTQDNSGLVLPDGVVCLFRLFADDEMIYEMPIIEPLQLLRPPSGLMAYEWQFEIVSCIAVYQVQLATTVKELQGA
jgi:hypothetical protein